MPEIVFTKYKSQAAINDRHADPKIFHGISQICFYFLRPAFFNSPYNTCYDTDPHNIPNNIRLFYIGKLHQNKIRKCSNKYKPAPKKKIK